MREEKGRRRSLRLRGYDYSQPGAYFITVCTNRRTLLLDVPSYKRVVLDSWFGLSGHYQHVILDAFVVMPNHVHGIIVLKEEVSVGAGFKPAPTQRARRHSLPEIVRAFKTFSARGVNALRGTVGVPLWQRSYYEHVIRNEQDLDRIREYIVNNPLRWAYDRENPDSAGADTAEIELWKFLEGRELPGVAAQRDK